MKIEPFRERIEQRNRLAKEALRTSAAEALAIVPSGDRDAESAEVLQTIRRSLSTVEGGLI